jgi:hypothetical protein
MLRRGQRRAGLNFSHGRPWLKFTLITCGNRVRHLRFAVWKIHVSFMNEALHVAFTGKP